MSNKPFHFFRLRRRRLLQVSRGRHQSPVSPERPSVRQLTLRAYTHFRPRCHVQNSQYPQPHGTCSLRCLPKSRPYQCPDGPCQTRLPQWRALGILGEADGRLLEPRCRDRVHLRGRVSGDGAQCSRGKVWLHAVLHVRPVPNSAMSSLQKCRCAHLRGVLQLAHPLHAFSGTNSI